MIGDSKFLKQDRTDTQTLELELAAAKGFLPAIAEVGKTSSVKRKLATLEQHYRFPEILRQGTWGKTLAACAKSHSKWLCENPSCGRWSYQREAQKDLRRQVRSYDDLVLTAYEFVASEVARKHGMSNVFDSGDHRLAKRLRVRPLRSCCCMQVSYCGNACHTYHFHNGHKELCQLI